VSTYKKEFGTGVQNNAGDYTGAVQGQLWYNSTAGSFQFRSLTTAGAWSTGNNMNTARRVEGTGTQTAALGFGGVFSALTESYNGTSWTEVNDLNTARYELGPAGTQTSALGFGGATPPAVAVTESWNGTCWTEVNDLNTARYQAGGAGADNTSALGFGGFSTTQSALTESWNGTCWTEVNDLNTAREGITGCGTQPAALAFGGLDSVPAVTAVTESWNGTCWAEVNDLNTARRLSAGAGTQTSALCIGGYITSMQSLTETWNGTSWSEDTDLSTARNQLGGAGTGNISALAFGGNLGTAATAATEEWTGAGSPVTETITTS
jgi:hypothetical protein